MIHASNINEKYFILVTDASSFSELLRNVVRLLFSYSHNLIQCFYLNIVFKINARIIKMPCEIIIKNFNDFIQNASNVQTKQEFKFLGILRTTNFTQPYILPFYAINIFLLGMFINDSIYGETKPQCA